MGDTLRANRGRAPLCEMARAPRELLEHWARRPTDKHGQPLSFPGVDMGRMDVQLRRGLSLTDLEAGVLRGAADKAGHAAQKLDFREKRESLRNWAAESHQRCAGALHAVTKRGFGGHGLRVT